MRGNPNTTRLVNLHQHARIAGSMHYRPGEGPHGGDYDVRFDFSLDSSSSGYRGTNEKFDAAVTFVEVATECSHDDALVLVTMLSSAVFALHRLYKASETVRPK